MALSTDTENRHDCVVGITAWAIGNVSKTILKQFVAVQKQLIR